MDAATDGPILPPFRIGVEVGGTFTDLVWADASGIVRTGKTPSTPHAVEEAVLSLIRATGLPLSRVSQITHGSTVATNALIMRKGASVGLLTTRGFRDIVILGRCERNHNVYDMQYRATVPPIRRHMIREVSERIGADGAVLAPIELEQAWREVEALLEQGVTGIAICLLNSYANPTHEIALAEMIRQRAPRISVSVSSTVSPEFREYERSVTTLANAFVGPLVEHYVRLLDEGVRASGYDGTLNIMQSNGGIMPASAAGQNAVRMMLSGPAAGVCAATWFASRNGFRDILTLDMGGTSTDVAIALDLVPGMVTELTVDGLPLRTTSVDMATIGAGGGSIAHIDLGGLLAVGPESAGSYPGPACYGRGGTRPTVADAQMVAGLLRPSDFFDGRMMLDIEKARQAIAGLRAHGLQGSIEDIADAILRTTNATMAGAVRQVSTARGIDPRGFTLVAYGGGGPLHAAMVAEEIGIRQVLVPWSPGLASAFGLLVAETKIDAVESDLHPLADSSLDATRLRGLIDKARQSAIGNNLADADYDISIGLDMRYAGQAFEITVWTEPTPSDAATLRQLFEAAHMQRFGYQRPRLHCEVVAYRLRISRKAGDAVATPVEHDAHAESRKVEIALNGRRHQAVLLPRAALAIGQRLAGPAILTEPTSTSVVPEGWDAERLPSGDLLLRDVK